MDLRFKINQKKCKQCGSCEKICPNRLKVSERAFVDLNNKECIRCYHCYAICPEKAIGINGSENGKLPKFNSMDNIEPGSLVNFLAYRRSHRRFKDKMIEADIIKRLIHTAGFIPSGGNSHSYNFTIITDGDVRASLLSELEKIYNLKKKILQSSFLRKTLYFFVDSTTKAFLKDREYLKRISDLLDQLKNGSEPIFYNAPVIIIIHSRKLIPTPKEDCVLAAYNITLMAQTLGLGSCMVSLAQNAINSSRRCKDIINLSPEDNVNAVVVLGYPEKKFLRNIPKDPKPINWSIA
ncbi:nitroreductase family protein [Actinomycetota bacterium]